MHGGTAELLTWHATGRAWRTWRVLSRHRSRCVSAVPQVTARQCRATGHDAAVPHARARLLLAFVRVRVCIG
ncbi:hypothetical protein SORBI_3009G095200 [Sorghum bicolor]|uniref:Uncharacterized protein n=1 Tax=Sorghum bicolor TaxID=4558 RepID=A0A1B6P827_SORBI|nr:hypothetical protein SORBI_3009G095200 [Sorghum bicolor]